MPAPTNALATIDGSPRQAGVIDGSARALPVIQPSSQAAPIPPQLDAGTLSQTIRTTYSTRFIILTSSRVFFGDGSANYSGIVPDGTIDGEIDLVVLASKVVSIILTADQNVVVKTNSASTPQETITLVQNQPLFWNNVDGPHQPYAFPYSGNVSKFYVTNTSGAPVKLGLAHLLDLRF
jgi:hypothetical protein